MINDGLFYGNSASHLVDSSLGWTHVELGAANYGNNFPETIEETQFLILYRTIDELVSKLGLKGTIYINDYQDETTEYCIQHLNGHLSKTHPEHAIRIEKLVGDYFKIDLPSCTSMHLKNPELSRLERLFSGKYVDRIVDMASKSKSGLMVQTIFHAEPPFYGFSDPRLEKELIPNQNCLEYTLPNGPALSGPHVAFSIRDLSTSRQY